MKIEWKQETDNVYHATNVGKLVISIFLRDNAWPDGPYWELRSLKYDNREYFVVKRLTKLDLIEMFEEAETLLIEEAKKEFGVLV